jgi:hypothetical protein
LIVLRQALKYVGRNKAIQMAIGLVIAIYLYSVWRFVQMIDSKKNQGAFCMALKQKLAMFFALLMGKRRQ